MPASSVYDVHILNNLKKSLLAKRPNSIQDTNTLRLLNLISENSNLTQRAIAAQSRLSLGLVNLTVRRLIQTGHIKISNLNKKKVEYLLTPKGFLEKANHSYAYLSRTLRVFLEYEKRLLAIIDQSVKEGVTSFAILGKGEIAELAMIAVKQYPCQLTCRKIREGEPPRPREIILDCRVYERDSSPVGISVLSALLEGSQVEL